MINELLMYAENHRHDSSKDHLEMVISGQFSVDLVDQARSTLVREFGHLCLFHGDMQKKRQSSCNRSEVMAMVGDIVKALELLEQNHVGAVFVAKDWSKVPKVHPEQVTDLSMADKVAQIEAKLQMYEQTMSQLRGETLATKDRITSLESDSEAHGQQLHQILSSVVLKKGDSKTPSMAQAVIGGASSGPMAAGSGGSGLPVTILGASTATDTDDSDDHDGENVSTSSEPPAASLGNNRDVFFSPQGRPASKQLQAAQLLGRGRANSEPDGTSNQAPFYRPKDQLRRERNKKHLQQPKGRPPPASQVGTRIQPIIGQAKDTLIRAAPAPDVELTVTRVDSNCSLKNLSDYINRKGVVHLDLQVLKEGPYYNTYYVKIAQRDVHKVRDGNFWPEGIHVRKYFPPR